MTGCGSWGRSGGRGSDHPAAIRLRYGAAVAVTVDLDRAVVRIDELLATEIARGGTPGVAVAITDAQRVLHVATAGHANLWAREAVRPEHLFEIGSIGKTFTALVVMQLWDEGRLEPDDPVIRHLPWFVVRSAQPITLAHLLGHRAGITSGIGEGTPEATVQAWALRDLPAGSLPGTRFHYSNLGYKVLGLVIEAVDGRPYPDALRDRVLEPLGMTSSEPAIRSADRARYAVGHARAADDRIGHPGIPLVPATWLETDTADGSIASTATDMTALARLVLRRGAGPAGRLISERAWQRMATPIPVDDAVGYGFALITRTLGDRTLVSHNGGMVGYLSTMQVEPAAGLGVVVLMNGPGSPVELGRAILVACREPGGVARPDSAAPPESESGLTAPVAALAGEYHAVDGSGRFRLEAGRDGLRFGTAGIQDLAVETWDDERHLVPHHDWDRFLLVTERAVDGPTTIWHGETRYVRAGVAAAPLPPPDPTLLPHRGHYRSHDPWTPNYRVLLRGDRLWLQFPEAPDGAEPEQPLIPLGDGAFRLGEDEANPERMWFDLPIGGRTRRAWLAGWPSYRVGD